MYNRKPTTIFKHIDFALVDEVALLLSFLIAWAIRFPGEGNPLSQSVYFGLFGIMAVMLFICGIITGNYHDVLRRGVMIELGSVFVLGFFTMALTALFFYFMKTSTVYSRLLLLYTFVVFLFVGLGFRLLWKKLVICQKKNATTTTTTTTTRRVFILTDSAHAEEICRTIRSDFLDGYIIGGVSLMDAPENFHIEGVDSILPLDEAADFICREWIDEVFVYLSSGIEQPNVFLAACSEMAVAIHYVLNLQGADQDKSFIETIEGKTVLTTAFNYMAPHQKIIKRLMDIAGGLVGAILAVLIVLITGPIVYAKDPGPVLFRQERIGRNGKHFFIYKIRSMYKNAEEMKKEYLAKNRVSDGYMFKLDNDPRILPGIGNFIRKTSLDEFPQFFNVLLGEMSLVGTRPPTVDEWEKYKYHHRARLSMRPGITGMWQVSGRSEITDFDEVVKLDTYYISHYRLSLDLKILFKTVAVLFQRKGAM